MAGAPTAWRPWTPRGPFPYALVCKSVNLFNLIFVAEEVSVELVITLPNERSNQIER